MKFLTALNFTPTFPDNVEIVGFEVYPVKEVREKRKVVEHIKCEEHEANAYCLGAHTGIGDFQWIADFKTKQDADTFALLLQSIYRSGANYKPAETNSQREEFGFGVEDIMNTANEELIWLTEADVNAVFDIMVDRADMGIGVSWENIRMALKEWLEDTQRERFPSYTKEELEGIESHDFPDYMRIIPKTEAKLDGRCYALDLNDGSEFLLDNDHDLQGLIESGEIAFGYE